MRAYQKLLAFSLVGMCQTVLSQVITPAQLNPSSKDQELLLESLYLPVDNGIRAEIHLMESAQITSASDHQCKQSKAASGDKAKVYFMRLYSEFAPHYKSFIDSNYCGPGCYKLVVNNQLTEPSSDTTNDQLFDSFGSVVHETVHTFDRHTKLMVEPGIVIGFQPTETVYSEGIASIVPVDASEKIFRYKTYVGKGSEVSANKDGIYGLVDEFTAYRNGTKACIDAATVAKSKGNIKRTEGFLKQATQTYYACYEFRLFIGWYLKYLEKTKPSAYTALMNNTNFRISYTLIEQGFLKDIQTMEKLINETPSVKWYYDYYEKEYSVYCKEHLREVANQLSALKVEGVDQSNYRQFLKKATYY